MEVFMLINSGEKERVEEAKKYIKTKKIPVANENIVSYNNFKMKIEEKMIIFHVFYDSKDERCRKTAEQNKIVGGVNISISGDSDQYIDKIIDKPDAEVMTKYIRESVKENINLKTEEKSKKYDNKGKGQIITVNSPKGGVGKSLIAFTLAYVAGIVKREEKKILLVDYNISEGSITRYFREADKHAARLDGVVEQFVKTGEISKVFLEDTIVEEPTVAASGEKFYGIDILFSPDNFITIPRKINSNPEFNVELFDALRTMYDLIIVDTSNEKNMTSNDYLAKNSDKVLFVVTTNPNSIIQLKDYIHGIGLKKDKYDLIYNDFNSYTSVFSIESIVAGIFNIENDNKEIAEIIKKKVFVLESNIGIKKADHNWDIMFNKEKKYITQDEREKYLNLFYDILNANCSEFITVINSFVEKKKTKNFFGIGKK